MLLWHQYVLWIAPAVGQCFIALFLSRRKLSAGYPVFRAYVFFHIVQLPIELYCYFHSHALYFYAFWIMQAFDFLLVIAVIQEAFSAVLRDYATLRRVATNVYRGTVLLLVAVAFGTALFAPGTEEDRTVAGLLTLDTSSMIIQLGVLVVLFLMSRILVLGWREFPFGIALGFGVMASMQLAVSMMRSYLGSESTPGYVLLRPLAYNLAVLIWLFYASKRERRRPLSELLPPEADVNRWNEALEKMPRL
jgi:hypothetical protein